MKIKYKVIKDFKIIPSGTVLEPNNNGEYVYEVTNDDVITSMSIKPDYLNNKEFFKPINAVEVTITEQDLDSSIRKNWRVVLDINCTEKDLLEIKKFIEDGIPDLIY